MKNSLRDGFDNPFPQGPTTTKKSLRDGFDSPFSKYGPKRGIRNSSGNDYRHGMDKIDSTGDNMRNLSSNMSGIGNRLMGHFDDYFAPAMDKAAQFADVNEQQMVDEASLDVNNAYDKMEDSQARKLSRYGISPTSGKFQGQQQDLNLMRAAAEAGARNKSRIQARDLSFNRNMQVAGMAQPLAGQAANVHASASGMMGNAANIHNNVANNARQDSIAEASHESYMNSGQPKRTPRRQVQLVH